MLSSYVFKRIKETNIKIVNNFISVIWNSTYFMLRRLNKLKGIANELATKSDQINGLTAKQKDKLSQLQLINPEWNVIDDLTKLLYPFYECTKMLSGSKYCTLSNAFVAKKMLLSFIQTQDETDSIFLNSLKKQLILIALYHLEDKLEIR